MEVDRRTVVGVAARERKKKEVGRVRSPHDSPETKGRAAEKIEAAAELRAAADLRYGGSCRSEEEGVGARESAKGQPQGLWVSFYRVRRGRGGDGREQWPSMPWRAGCFKAFKGALD
jgi:hypothetical protein